MPEEKDGFPTHTHVSSRTTGDAPVDGIGSGGTHPAPKANERDKDGTARVTQKVSTGDRNTGPGAGS